ESFVLQRSVVVPFWLPPLAPLSDAPFWINNPPPKPLVMLSITRLGRWRHAFASKPLFQPSLIGSSMSAPTARSMTGSQITAKHSQKLLLSVTRRAADV